MVVEGSKHGQDVVTAVLCSGGLDSAVLVAHQAKATIVQPIYLRAGLGWETLEVRYLDRFLAADCLDGRVRARVDLASSVTDIYAPSHWALVGEPPAYDTPDEEVYLIGRNVLLLSKTAVYCAVNGIGRVAVGLLAGNPFPDATPEFFAAMTRALVMGLDYNIEIVAPFSAFSKADVIRLGASLEVPFADTLSCMNPSDDMHCGRCSKCRERLQAFAAVGLHDPAVYAFCPTDVATGQ